MTTAADTAKTKDNDADIINVVIEELIKQRYELPAFSTLVRVARSVRRIVYKSYYHTIYESLSKCIVSCEHARCHGEYPCRVASYNHSVK